MCKVLVKLLFVILLLLELAPLQEGCHSGQSKRKKRTTNANSDNDDARRYFAGCLTATVGLSSVYDFQSNVDYTILLSNWFMNTEEVICATETGYNNATCWSTEIDEYLNNDDLLPFVKTCIKNYFEDYSYDPPQPRYPAPSKRSVSQPISNPPNITKINGAYLKCVNTSFNQSYDWYKLLASMDRHSVLRKCDAAFASRHLGYQRKFLALTRPDSQLRKSVYDCNKRDFPAGNFWSIWSPWSRCDPSCNGLQKRTRKCVNGDEPTRKQAVSLCPGVAIQKRPCPGSACWSKWSQWSRCSVRCGTGRRFRTRICTIRGSSPSLRLSCPGFFKQWSKCIKPRCRPKVNG